MDLHKHLTPAEREQLTELYCHLDEDEVEAIESTVVPHIAARKAEDHS